MNKTLLKGMMLTLASATIFTACKKEQENIIPTPQQYLAGSWSMTAYATDYNENGVMDDHEKDYDLDQTSLVFNTDGTGYSSYTSTWYPDSTSEEREYFSWAVLNEGKELRIISTEYYGVDTMQAKINSLNSTECILEYEDDYGYGPTYKEWLILNKKL